MGDKAGTYASLVKTVIMWTVNSYVPQYAKRRKRKHFVLTYSHIRWLRRRRSHLPPTQLERYVELGLAESRGSAGEPLACSALAHCSLLECATHLSAFTIACAAGSEELICWPVIRLPHLLTYLLSHSRGAPLSHLHCPVGQLRSRVVGPECVGH